MQTVKSYAAHAAHTPLVPFSFARRTPNDDDVAIAIHYCGICHTDLGFVDNAWGFSRYPLVPGHEIAGVVTAVGARVTKFKVGDRVGVGCFVDSCTHCGQRDVDHEHYLPGLVMTYNGVEADGTTPTQGGYSQAIVVKEGYVLAIPDTLPLDAAAPLLCAGIALYSPLRHGQAGPGKKVAIVGMGGLGHMGVQLAHAMGAEVTVLSQSLAKQQDGLRLGADHYHATADASTFQTLAGSFDLIICTVPAGLDWNAYLGLLKLDGALVLIGVPDQDIVLSAFPLIVGRRSLSGSYMGSIQETQQMLDFCGQHQIVAEIETIAMQDINTAFERLKRGDVRFRFVIDMATLEA